MDAVGRQRAYYQATATEYDRLHGDSPEHDFALSFLASAVERQKFKSILDVGAGTGRVWLGLQSQTRVTGIEPVAALREVGHARGIPSHDLIDGSALQLPFEDKSFDAVCAFGVMHHLPDPTRAALEMVRVARRAIFISDHNDYGRGSVLTKAVKQAAKNAGLWRAYRFFITRGKGYRVTADDGVWYPYSIFDTYKVIRPHCSDVHFLSTLSAGPNLFRSASHVAMLGIL